MYANTKTGTHAERHANRDTCVELEFVGAGEGGGAGREGRGDGPVHHVGPLDPPSVPLRHLDGPGLEADDPAGVG